MAEQTQNTGSGDTQNKNKGTIFYLLLILLLTGGTIYSYFNFTQKAKELTVANSHLNSDSIRIDSLDDAYKASLNQIEDYKGRNAHLDSVLNVREASIKSMIGQLDQARAQNKLSEADFQKKLGALQMQNDSLDTQIVQLTHDKQILMGKNDSLGTEITKQVATNQDLTNQNKVLSTKAQLGALLKPMNLAVTSIRYKSSGKEVFTNSHKDVQAFKVTFNVDKNLVADPGDKTFYCRILGPDKAPISIESLGSGSFTMNDGTQQQFTLQQSINYTQAPMPVTLLWKQNTPYAVGSYTFEIYQDGYETGSTTLALK
jgi:hypothetical protein